MKKKILLVTERSAGHIYPALVLAEEIKKKSNNHVISFFTSSNFFKKNLKKRGYLVFGLSFSFRNIFFEFLSRAVEAIYILLRVFPNQVVGFGGRDSFWLVFFSSFLTKKTSIYELNAKMGKANKLLSFFVKDVFRGLPPLDKGKKDKVIGIALGKNQVKVKKEVARQRIGFNQEPVILCFGGSQGSTFINQIFMKFASNHNRQPYQIIHVSGERDYPRVLLFYKNVSNNKLVKGFSWEMPLYYRAADTVICRAGALTLANLSFYNLPAVLIPHPQGRGHQKLNALYLAKKGAAFVFNQEKFNFNSFENCLEKLIWDNIFREKIKNNLDKAKLEIISENFSFNFSF